MVDYTEADLEQNREIDELKSAARELSHRLDSLEHRTGNIEQVSQALVERTGNHTRKFIEWEPLQDLIAFVDKIKELVGRLP